MCHFPQSFDTVGLVIEKKTSNPQKAEAFSLSETGKEKNPDGNALTKVQWEKQP